MNILLIIYILFSVIIGGAMILTSDGDILLGEPPKIGQFFGGVAIISLAILILYYTGSSGA